MQFIMPLRIKKTGSHKKCIEWSTNNKNLNSGDYLIDDRTANGAGEFKGEHIHFLTKQFRGWDDVLSYLIPNANQ